MADSNKLRPWLKKAEGGLSKARTDSARAWPVPDALNPRYQQYNGKGYHTNKGVTWRTFQGLASQLGYIATPERFYDMPENIWRAIFKAGYWDKVKGDDIKSQPIADTLADFAYGAGPVAAGRSVQRVLVAMGLLEAKDVDGKIGPQTVGAINRAPEGELFEKLTQYKLKFYTSLPGQEANYAGWKKRILDLYNLKKKSLQQEPLEQAA